jgi:hypothetical protein
MAILHDARLRANWVRRGAHRGDASRWIESCNMQAVPRAAAAAAAERRA